VQLTESAARVLGCLLEKARTTPDQYPLSLNALVAACNQTTNRWPVVRYDERTVEAALDELREQGLVRREKPYGGRAIKYSELLGGALRIGEPELAVLCVLLLRGPQTPGELKARTERLHEFADLEGIEAALRALAEHEDGPLVERLGREPGRKEPRWVDRLHAHAPDAVVAADPAVASPPVASVTTPELVARVESLEAAVRELTARVDGLGRDTRH
jgi:uncharacterized protein YceH (UPF0502 family)